MRSPHPALRATRRSIRSHNHTTDLFSPLERRELFAAMLALAPDNVLLRFDSAAPSVIQSGVIVSGMASTERLMGIDFRPSNGQLYGLAGTTASVSGLYTIDIATGAATRVGSITGIVIPATTSIGMDFNPVADRLRITDANGGNWRLNPDTAALVATDTSIAGGSRMLGVAYSNNTAGASTTVMYAIDEQNDQLVNFTLPNSGVFAPIGALGFNTVGTAGFDIDASGTAWATLRLSTNFNRFGTINLATGAFTSIGSIGSSDTLNVLGLAAIPTRNAPAFGGGLTPSVTSIAEDSAPGSGTTISALIASSGGNLITDVNAGALEGVAITGADTANGSWEYSLNGSAWFALANVFDFHALLLPADGTASVRFTPSENYNGTLTSALTFRAWDRTSGTSGGRADTSSSGGSTAFSASTVAATLTVTPTYDAPVFGGEFTKRGPIADNSTFQPFEGLGITYIDSTSQTMTVSLAVLVSEIGVFTPASLTASGFVAQVTPGVYAFTGTAAACTTALQALIFDPTNNLTTIGLATAAEIGMTIDDGIGPDVTPAPVQFAVESANDAPTIAGLTPNNTLQEGATIKPMRRMRFTDPDLNDTLTVVIALDKPLKGKFTPATLTASGFTRVTGARGRFQFVGTAASATTAIRKLRYQFNNNLDGGQTHRVRFTVTATDAASSAATNNTTTVTLV